MRETTANANPTDSFPRHHASWTSGLNRHSRLLHETVASDCAVEPTCTDFAIKYKTETQQVCCLTQTCLPQILFCFSFKYMKLTADVVLKIINTSSPSDRGLLHFLVFSSCVNSTWQKAIQIIKHVFYFLFSSSTSTSARRTSGLEASRFSPEHQPTR